MARSFVKILSGYKEFRQKYVLGDNAIMHYLSHHGQRPEIMVVSCCDSRVDPALILQCDPGDLFVVRNVANIVPPYERDQGYHGTSAALEFGINSIKVKHLILLGHSRCGGIKVLLEKHNSNNDDFITKWLSILKIESCTNDIDECAKIALKQSYQNCLTFPWIYDKILRKVLVIHLWFFDIGTGQILAYLEKNDKYVPLI